MKPIGISILTNGNRSRFLTNCVSSLLENSFTRPIIIGIMDNGSTDDTPSVCRELVRSNYYGIEWRLQRSEIDRGCAWGTNVAHNLVKDTEFVLHIESDFRHLSELESGIGKLWLREALALLETRLADYIYLRRFRNDSEMSTHWFHQWKQKIVEVRGQFQRCDGFWYSNNPSIFRIQALYDCRTLPLNEKLDGIKGTPNWSRPELSAPHPTRTWFWGYGEGMFIHDG
jgi:glycosyltransferase involved in cell wall biosynthesis